MATIYSRGHSAMRRWSGEKLDKELMFAHACLDDSAETMAWLSALEREQDRRNRPATLAQVQS